MPIRCTVHSIASDDRVGLLLLNEVARLGAPDARVGKLALERGEVVAAHQRIAMTPHQPDRAREIEQPLGGARSSAAIGGERGEIDHRATS